MAIITLTSDWGIADHYTGAVKGTILSELPDATIVDITHQIQPFNLYQASFVLRNSYKSFPANTIHIIDVCSDASKTTPHCVVQMNDQYFVGADNGIFSLVFDGPPDKIIELDTNQSSSPGIFSARDVFARAAVALARGDDFSSLGKPRAQLTERMPFTPVVESNVLKGKVIYIDGYNNVFINITEKYFLEVGNGRPFSINLRNAVYTIRQISRAYNEVGEGEMVAMFSSSGYLEIAINLGKASTLLGLHIDDMIRIEFAE